MPVDQATTINIVCDNPACPGNTLDPTDRTGWLFVNSEVYGEPTAQNVFCSQACVNAVTVPEVAAPVFDWERAGNADAVRERSRPEVPTPTPRRPENE